MDAKNGARRLRTATVVLVVAATLLAGCSSDSLDEGSDDEDSRASTSDDDGPDSAAVGSEGAEGDTNGSTNTCESAVADATDQSVLTTADAVEQGFADAAADRSVSAVVFDALSPSLEKCVAVFGPGEYLEGAGEAEVSGLAMSSDYDYLEGVGSAGRFECVYFGDDSNAKVDEASAQCTDGELIVGVRLTAPDGETVTAYQAQTIGLAVAAENAG